MTAVLVIPEREISANAATTMTAEDCNWHDIHLVNQYDSDMDSMASDPYIKCDRSFFSSRSEISLTNIDLPVPSLDDENEISMAASEVATSLKPDETERAIIVKEMDDNSIPDSLPPICLKQYYGGFTNLGNTCYMAAALQMLASIDEFVLSLRNDCGTAKDNYLRCPEDSIRRLFVDMVWQMNEGKTVKPEGFKRALEVRRPLFGGFDQQDAQEFLMAFLDLVEEEYGHSNEARPDETSNDFQADKSYPDLVAKGARSEQHNFTSQSGKINNYCLSATTLTELDVNAIDALLHDSNDNNDVFLLPAMATVTEHHATQSNAIRKCKLAGGRMTTALNPGAYVSSCHSAFSNSFYLQTKKARSALANDYATISNPDLISHEQETSRVCNVSPVTDFFEVKVRVRLTCDSCMYSRVQDANYQVLPLEICNDEAAFSIRDSLRLFFAPERRDIKCEKCFCETSLQTNEITKLPRALLLHLKRFDVDVSPDFSSITYTKNQSSVVVDKEITLDDDSGAFSDFLSSDCTFPAGVSKDSLRNASYEIRSIVNHIGSSVGCGHYTNDSMKMYNDGIRKWTRFNDSNVTLLAPEEAIEDGKQTAYIVLYECSMQ
jgi:ubiquitin C-terminal hydrolase